VPPQSVRPVSRAAIRRSCQLISDSCALITTARELIAQSRTSRARQSYMRIVCAWCQTTIRFEGCTVAARGQVSHSICYDCFARVCAELTPSPLLPAYSPQLP
jgi:hypothetical protein